VNDEDLPIQDLLDWAPSGFIVVDQGGSIVFTNSTACDLFGFEPDELLGQPIHVLIPERFHEIHRQHRRTYMKEPQIRPMGLGLDLFGRHKNGTEFPVDISLSPLQTADKTLYTAVIRDNSDRKAMEEQRLALELELETERERDRIAMDLHDGIMQDVYAASLGLELALAGGETSSDTAESIERVIDQLQTVVQNIRSYIFDLRPREFSGDLSEAFANLANEFQQNSQIQTELEMDVAASPHLTTSLTVYNIAHEGLSNVQRHAQAERVTISLQVDQDGGELRVSDDGVGFDAGADRGQSHRGLRNMVARAKSIGAELSLESKPGKGTRLALRFPLDPPNA
jgi:PAS domain S-box-containing protein